MSYIVSTLVYRYNPKDFRLVGGYILSLGLAYVVLSLEEGW